MAPLLPPLVATATSQTVPAQSQVLNTQIQLNDVLATATLNVVDTSLDSTATAIASGNNVTASTGQGGLDFQSSQTLSANVQALTTLNVTTNSGTNTAQSTYAVGNAGEAGSYGGDRVVGTIDQTAGAVNILATGRYEGATAKTGAISTSVTAVANSQGVITDNGSAGLTIVQTSQALTQADGGSVLQHTPGQGTFSALATSNNLTLQGTGGSTQSIDITQTMTGARTQAAEFTAVGNGQALTTSATASANNSSRTNENGPLEVTARQSNTSYRRAQAEASAFEFGSMTALAYGVGNSVMAGNYGQEVSIDSTQFNGGGGVEVISVATGDNGYDTYGSAVAVGNAITGYACSSCYGRLTSNSQQTSSADVSATSTVSVATSNRSASASASATGNTASYYTSSPH